MFNIIIQIQSLASFKISTVQDWEGLLGEGSLLTRFARHLLLVVGRRESSAYGQHGHKGSLYSILEKQAFEYS